MIWEVPLRRIRQSRAWQYLGISIAIAKFVMRPSVRVYCQVLFKVGNRNANVSIDLWNTIASKLPWKRACHFNWNLKAAIAESFQKCNCSCQVLDCRMHLRLIFQYCSWLATRQAHNSQRKAKQNLGNECPPHSAFPKSNPAAPQWSIVIMKALIIIWLAS